MEDGLYRVTTPYLCAGFTVKQNKLYSCAPILRRKIEYWKTIATHIKPMRPYELLPLPFPAEYDPSEKEPDYFYQNFLRHFIPDMIQMMDTGLHIDEKAVEELRQTIDNVLATVQERLSKNSLIQQYQESILPAAQKAHAEKATQAVRDVAFYLKEFDDKNIIHRTWVVNTYLKTLRKEKDKKEKWSLKDLKGYNLYLSDPFLQALVEKRSLKNNKHVKEGMLALAEYRTELWNYARYEKAKEPVKLEPFNAGSAKQKQELFEMLGIEALATSKDTGQPSWGRDQLEELKLQTNDQELLEVLDALIDFSYSAIIKNNFLKAFDAFTVDGVLHGNIKLFGAKSCRNTSNAPNLLNAPSTGSIYAKPLKRCFVAPKKFIVYTADLNGLEDRCIANLSGDTNKQAIFLENLDGHSLAATYYFKQRLTAIIGEYSNHKDASRLLAALVEEKNKIAKAIRQDGKPGTFGLSYGAYPPKLAQTLKCPLEEAEHIFNAYHHELYPGITRYREDYVLKTARQQGYIHLGLGCRMYTSDADKAIRTLANATVQFWSILTLIAINELNHRIRLENLTKEIQVTSTIYDSIYTQCIADAEIISWLNKTMIELMTVQYLENEVIHNEAAGELGLNWADLHKVPNNASPSEIQAILDTL